MHMRMRTELLDDLRREDARGERASEDGRELGVQAADAELLEVPVRVDDRHVRVLPARARTIEQSMTSI